MPGILQRHGLRAGVEEHDLREHGPRLLLPIGGGPVVARREAAALQGSQHITTMANTPRVWCSGRRQPGVRDRPAPPRRQGPDWSKLPLRARCRPPPAATDRHGLRRQARPAAALQRRRQEQGDVMAYDFKSGEASGWAPGKARPRSVPERPVPPRLDAVLIGNHTAGEAARSSGRSTTARRTPGSASSGP